MAVLYDGGILLQLSVEGSNVFTIVEKRKPHTTIGGVVTINRFL